MYIDAQTLYQALINGWIINAEGVIKFSMLGVDQTIKEKSAFGDLIQEWLWWWMSENGIEYRTKENTQEFPDFLLDKTSNEKGLLEIKSFDYTASPNFDVANFEAYVRSLTTKSYRIDADYLIFWYTLINGVVTIKNIWLKKIWEICCPSEKFPLRVQCKQDMIYNIRPANWYSESANYTPFQNKKQFLDAIQGTLNQYHKTSTTHRNWLNEVLNNYKQYEN